MNPSDRPTEAELLQEGKSRLREALLQADVLREEFAQILTRQLKRKIFLDAPAVIHERLRWLNLRTLELRFFLTQEEIASVLIRAHSGSLKRSQATRGLGVPASHLFGPAGMARFEEIVQDLHPHAEERRKSQARLEASAGAFDPSPLPDDLSHLTGNYRERTRLVQKRMQEVAARYRRPFRQSPWK